MYSGTQQEKEAREAIANQQVRKQLDECGVTDANPSNALGGLGNAGIASAYARRASLAEENQKAAQHHFEQGDRATRASAFFAAHPEFDEFIRLIREGVIGI